MPIDRIEVYITDLPARFQRQTAGSGSDTGTSKDPMGKPVLVKIFADGVVGYGQVRPTGRNHWLSDTSYSVVAAVRDYYGPRLIGSKLSDLELLWHDFDRILPKNGPARCVIDYALHDALGKQLGVPAHVLLGGAAQPVIPMEWSVSLAETNAEMVDDCRRAFDEYGINNFSLKAGGPKGWKIELDLVRAVREAMGDEAEIGLDANMAWTVPQAISALRAMSEYEIEYVEQPVHRTDLAGLAQVRAGVGGVAVIADESVNDVHDVMTIAEAHAADAVCVKLQKLGGLRSAKKLTAIAEAANLQVNVGGTAIMSQIEAAAIAHYYASVPAAVMLPGAEFVFGLGGVLQDPLVPQMDFVIGRDGTVTVPMTPGLGVVVDDEAVAALALSSDVVTGSS
jgi:L-alanine-DL-glutamate epimerase-like enolase superfamily enzyme